MIKTIPKKDAARPRRGRRLAQPAAKAAAAPARLALEIRPVRRADIDAVIGIDATVTGLEKRDYWLSLYRRYGRSASAAQHFLVALRAGEVVGFIIGEVRDWEFGSPPCGWVFGIDVRPDARLGGTGTQLLNAICANFRRAGIRTVRTILARDNTLVLSFFRSQGMTAGPFIPLEMDIDG